MEIDRAKTDLKLGIPINTNRVETLLKLIATNNTKATSTASVEKKLTLG